MREELLVVAIERNHVSEIVENGHVGIHGAHRLGGSFKIALLHLMAMFFAIFPDVWIEPLPKHFLHTGRAAAIASLCDIEKNAIGVREETHDLFDLLAQVVQVAGIEAQEGESGFCMRGEFSVVSDDAPFRAFLRHFLIESRREIDGCCDADFLACVHLRPQQVERQMRVHDADGRRVIGEPVVALGKKGDRIDMAFHERLLEFFFMKSGSDSIDEGGCMEIQMDLTKAEMMHGKIVAKGDQ